MSGYSILNSGRQNLNQALDGYSYAAQSDAEREATKDAMDAADDAQKSQAIGTVGGIAANYALAAGTAAPITTSTGVAGAGATSGAAAGSTTAAGTTAAGTTAAGGTTAAAEGGSVFGGPFVWLAALISGKITHDISNDYYSGKDALTGRALVKNFDRKYEEQGNEAIEGLGSGGKLAASLASWDFGSAKEATEDGQHSIGLNLIKKIFGKDK